MWPLARAGIVVVVLIVIAKYSDMVRVAVTGAGNEGVFRWAEAEAALSARFEPAAVKGLMPDPSTLMGDMHASAEYRAHLVAVMTRRAVENIGGIPIA